MAIEVLIAGNDSQIAFYANEIADCIDVKSNVAFWINKNANFISVKSKPQIARLDLPCTAHDAASTAIMHVARGKGLLLGTFDAAQ